MDSIVGTSEDNKFLKLSFDDRKLDEKLLIKDLTVKDNRPLENRLIYNVRKLPITDKTTNDDDYDDTSEYEKKKIPKRVYFFIITVLFLHLLVLGISFGLEHSAKILGVDGNNNNSDVAIFTSNGVLQVESYTMNNTVFEGFIKKTVDEKAINNNSSVAILIPNGVLLLESFTVNNTFFIGFIAKNIQPL